MDSPVAAGGAKRNFILQQGLPEPAPSRCEAQYGALQVQPRVVGILVVLATVLQSAGLFLALGGLLWLGALLPRWNAIERIHALLRRGGEPIPPAPPPRRFSMGMAGSFCLAIGLLLAGGHRVAAYVVEGLMLAALAALVLGGFCLGSFLFHLLRGRASFACATLPWGRGGSGAP